MTIYSHNNLLIYRVFPFSLKGVTLDWFYSIPSRLLHNFEEVNQVFYIRYASR